MPGRQPRLQTHIQFLPGRGGVQDVDVGRPGERTRRVNTALAYLKGLAPDRPRPHRRQNGISARTRAKLRMTQTCWKRKHNLLSLIYRAVGDGRPCSSRQRWLARQRKPDAPSIRLAAEKTGFGRLKTAESVIWRYKKAGYCLRHPTEPYPRKTSKLDMYRDYLY